MLAREWSTGPALAPEQNRQHTDRLIICQAAKGEEAHTLPISLSNVNGERTEPEPQKQRLHRRSNGSAKMLWIAVVLLCGIVKQLDANCQAAGSHKASPSPEPNLHDCPIYSKNACCSADTDDKKSTLPDAAPWNRCAILSTKCEQFFKQLSCFYHCSPDTKTWASPGLPNRLVNVPLCHSFCDQWYKACKNDLTCTKNWNSGLKPSNATQTNCSSECIPYSKMYKNGKDLCESSVGDTFTVRSCSCLSMDKGDARMVATLVQNDSTKVGADGKLPCREKRSIMNKLRRSMHKRSLFVEDIDGSGSGFPSTE